MAGMQRTEVSAPCWDVADATDGDGVLITVRRSKSPAPSGRCGRPRARNGAIGWRCCRRRWWGCGLPRRLRPPASERRVPGHSGRVGLASELTSRGASTTDVMLAGNWKTSRMVALQHLCAADLATRRRFATDLTHRPGPLRPPRGCGRSRAGPHRRLRRAACSTGRRGGGLTGTVDGRRGRSGPQTSPPAIGREVTIEPHRHGKGRRRTRDRQEPRSDSERSC